MRSTHNLWLRWLIWQKHPTTQLSHQSSWDASTVPTNLETQDDTKWNLIKCSFLATTNVLFFLISLKAFQFNGLRCDVNFLYTSHMYAENFNTKNWFSVSKHCCTHHHYKISRHFSDLTWMKISVDRHTFQSGGHKRTFQFRLSRRVSLFLVLRGSCDEGSW